MSDMNFENLPSTSTPITAENLNKLNDVKVSSTEPATDRRKVWIKKGKNVFNAYQYTYYLRNSSESYVINSANSISVSGNNMSWSRTRVTIKGLTPNKKYTVSATVSNASGHWAGIMIMEGETELRNVGNSTNFKPRLTFTADSNGTKEVHLFSNWSDSALTETVTFNEIQLEQGEQMTEYEAYVEPSTYIKNDNGVYEEFKRDPIKMKVLDGATLNSNGNITTDIVKSKYAILSVDSNAGTILCTPFTYNGNDYWVLHFYKIADGSAASNSQIDNVKIYYTEI